MLDGFEMVVRIPYPVTVPKLYAVASEVATMCFLRSRGLPISQVYSYSPLPDNPAQTEYIFMEYVRGTNLSDVWFDLEERDIVSVLRQLVQLESRMMSIPFPAGGSLYYSHDLEEVTGGKSGTLLGGDERFCISLDARVHMWYRRRSQLEVDRGPYTTVEQALAAPARKELAYLAHFGRPLPPFQRERRELYEHKPQPPSDHAVNLERYLLAPSLVPANTVTHQFCIRHPDLQPGNIIILRSRDTNELRIESLLDWQHAAILPLFLHANIPGSMQNYDDPSSQLLVPPSLPANTGEQDEEAKGLYHRWLIHFHYWQLWEGGAPCPIVFEAEDVRTTNELAERLQLADENYEGVQRIVGFGAETWVPSKRYKMARDLAELLKLKVLMQIPEEEVRDKFDANWFLNDMDKTEYM
ncbi:hypothetical protein GLOTRDRAFT_128543 [Gloeophyllum trabeum ATCC 11539]|uniref:Aminoglycoside phosphotransferase domain-containing protein n=1 Tax=Gloeophyllum trabeum (strain ATCC 11539 / FP-39264 / Madison 617) TaxID=670483 RepID=S7RPV0_GLOTA|nr:uncharacterized protein GLOTRDRAFT_128543 [Gloeophyllum trabeum ATCC 11539]EPQ56600.1 hypothetical protein GLOTRDRAFT_128543 [Gloeophyllum trabeum ATCC 11539]